MKPCPNCGPLHDLDCVTCTRCGWVEALPEHSPAVQHAMVWLDAELANVDSPRQAREDAASALEAALTRLHKAIGEADDPRSARRAGGGVMGRHVPGKTWALRRPGTYPQVYVDTEGPENIKILHFGTAAGESEFPMTLTRRDARLLAKRLNQCLDETRS